MNKTEYNSLTHFEKSGLEMSDHDVKHSDKVKWFAQDIAEFVKENSADSDWDSLVMYLLMGPGEMIMEQNGFSYDVMGDIHKADGSYNRKGDDWRFFRWAIKKAQKGMR